MIETTFVNGINPFTTLVPETATERVEPINKSHVLYKWVLDHPMRSRMEIAIATGRSVNNVKRITDVMVKYGYMQYETHRTRGSLTHYVKAMP